MADTTQPDENRHLAIFRVAPYTFCAPAHTISTITDVPAWTRIPMTPPSILGAINHRGRVVVVISLRRKLGLEPLPRPSRSQLIITELDSGLTAFMVDEIEDVRPPGGMQRHPLSAFGAIDIFDAYLVDGDRILLQTTFQKLYDAGDSLLPDADMRAHLRQAEAKPRVADASPPTHSSPALPAAATAEPEQTPKPGVAATTTPPAIPTEKGAQHRLLQPEEAGPLPPEKDRRRLTAGPTATGVKRAQGDQWSHGPGRSSGRTPWYRYAVIAALLLVMTAALGAGVWLARHQAGMRVQATVPAVSQPDAPGTPETQTARARISSVRLENPTARAKTEEPTAPEAKLKDVPRAVSPTPAATERTTAEGTASTLAPAPERPAPPAEVLHVETDTFTLTIERPGDTTETQPNPAPGNAPATAAGEFRHVVVRGDTLWDIAAHYLDDPLQYRQLARLSQIQNPDLIYPDDIIRIVRRAPGNPAAPP